MSHVTVITNLVIKENPGISRQHPWENLLLLGIKIF